MPAYFVEALDCFISDLSKLYEIPAHVARLLLEIVTLCKGGRDIDQFQLAKACQVICLDTHSVQNTPISFSYSGITK